MGNTSAKPELNLGEITIQDDQSKAVLPCSATQANIVQVILQDKLGKSVLTKEFPVDETTEALIFDVSDCKPGEYHAWIYIKQKVFIKHFSLEENEPQTVFGKLRSMFK